MLPVGFKLPHRRNSCLGGQRTLEHFCRNTNRSQQQFHALVNQLARRQFVCLARQQLVLQRVGADHVVCRVHAVLLQRIANKRRESVTTQRLQRIAAFVGRSTRARHGCNHPGGHHEVQRDRLVVPHQDLDVVRHPEVCQHARKTPAFGCNTGRRGFEHVVDSIRIEQQHFVLVDRFQHALFHALQVEQAAAILDQAAVIRRNAPQVLAPL